LQYQKTGSIWTSYSSQCHYYMLYGTPNNPFNPKSSLIKLANKFIYYHRTGKSIDESVIAYKSGSLSKCQDIDVVDDVDWRYFRDLREIFQVTNVMGRIPFSKGFLAGEELPISRVINSLKRFFLLANGMRILWNRFQCGVRGSRQREKGSF